MKPLPIAIALFMAGFGLAVPPPCFAKGDPPPTGPVLAAMSDVIITGKVTKIEADPVQLVIPGTRETFPYKVFVVAVDDAVKGADGLKTVRIASPYLAVSTGLKKDTVRLKVGSEALFYLLKTDKADLFTAPQWYHGLIKKAADIEQTIANAKEITKMLADPIAALKDPVRERRVEAAGLLLVKYGEPRFGGKNKAKREPIDAEESKLILTTLAVADWKQPVRPGFIDPMTAFYYLELTEKDGYREPELVQGGRDEAANLMQQWLAKHADTYRILRSVPAK